MQTDDNPSPTQLIPDSSPLSAVSPSSPNNPTIDLKESIQKERENHPEKYEIENNSTTASSQPNNTTVTEQRSTSIASDQFSDLTELDSETETVKMYTNGTTSQLQSLANSHSLLGSAARHTKDEAGDQDTEELTANTVDAELMKNGVTMQIQDELRNEDHHVNDALESPEKLGEVISEEFKRASEEPDIMAETSKRKAEELEENNSKNDNEDSVSKKPKLEISSPPVAIEQTKTEAEVALELLNPDLISSLTAQHSEEAEAAASIAVTTTTTTTTTTSIPEGEEEEETQNDGTVLPTPATTDSVVAEDDAEAEGDHEESEAPEDGDEEDEDDEDKTPIIDSKQQRQDELLKQVEKEEAIKMLTEIEVDFAKLRDRLYDDKMARFKTELEMCLNGSHPDLQAVYSRIDTYREDKIKLAKLNHKYKLEGIERKTLATRTAIHQQFLRSKNDFKMKYLKDKTEEWYKINKERRLLDDVVPDYGYRRPEFTDDAVNQRLQVNKEIQTLNGLSVYYGFPTAQDFQSLDKDELDDDLRAMNIL
ncbi:hypothetical protein WICPIJ_001241 [Wickerhamomyces pijperi]|uniref:Transcriptional regulatory protein DEP1 n=1 Tax=Wickerhamomyces pijperi TaxID=599730 RepID=A0A9P8QC05_WICPI|nr:hypothetical protein WICPIJ_001241 [Wickerhamomyces pijperi]